MVLPRDLKDEKPDLSKRSMDVFLSARPVWRAEPPVDCGHRRKEAAILHA
jgi:hypothetical protein